MFNSVELQWLKHLWDHENKFETGVFVGKVAVCVHLNVFRFMCLILFSIVHEIVF